MRPPGTPDTRHLLISVWLTQPSVRPCGTCKATSGGNIIRQHGRHGEKQKAPRDTQGPGKLLTAEARRSLHPRKSAWSPCVGPGLRLLGNRRGPRVSAGPGPRLLGNRRVPRVSVGPGLLPHRALQPLWGKQAWPGVVVEPGAPRCPVLIPEPANGSALTAKGPHRSDPVKALRWRDCSR